MNEKYIPLYRKYRPQTLEEIVGQEHVKKSLTNAIELDKIAHAYLFTGPRGTGKTSGARILAKSLNCENGPTVKPCGKCASCIDITNSTPVDVIEIDAASNRKVEDAQNILEKIQYVPVNGKYKIYIIDEVHMLTNHAFNALLKTLEEPPKNVIFILATTEPQKVLDTIKSRCQRYDFKRITTEDITKHLKYIAKQEKINIEDEALLAIAKNSEGGMRDSIALLDQLSVLGSKDTITINDINSLLGRISFDVLVELSGKIISSNPQQSIETLEKIYNSGNEPSQILLNMLEFYKNMLLVKTCDEKIVLDLTQYSEKQIQEIKTQCSKLDTHQIIFLTEKISNYIKELKTNTNQHLWLEIALIDLANLAENTSLVDLQNRLTKLESGQSEIHTLQPVYKTAPAPSMKPTMKPANINLKPTVNEPLKKQDAIPAKTIKAENEVEIEVETKIEEEENFSPMPKSQPKPQEQKDLVALWQALLTNCGSLSALLQQQTKPLIISPEKVILISNSEFWVNKLNSEASKQKLIDACDLMFSQSNTNVLIRLPKNGETPSDVTIAQEEKKKAEPVTSKPIENKPILSETEKVKNVNEEQIIEPVENTEPIEEIPIVEVANINDKKMVSDQVTMVINLFDGKYIN